jgi:hypothetical protein
MEPSDLQKLLMEYSLEDHTPLDLRKSTFKKVGKLLEQMHQSNLIVYSENKAKGHKLISQVLRAELNDFVPQFKLKHTKKKVEESKSVAEDTYPKVQIEEVYQLGKNLAKLNSALKQPKD